MALFRCGGGGGGGAPTTGTLTTSATSTNYTIQTGVSNLKHFIAHSVDTASYGTDMQKYLEWDSAAPSKFYYISLYTSAGGVGYADLTSTALARAPVMVSVTPSTGTVVIKTASMNNWQNDQYTWYAW